MTLTLSGPLSRALPLVMVVAALALAARSGDPASLIAATPVVIGGLVAAVRWPRLSDWVEGGEGFLRRRRSAVTGSGPWAKLVSRPFWAGALFGWDAFGKPRDPHVRAGLHSFLVLIYAGLSVALLVAAVYLLVMAVLVAMALAFVLWFFASMIKSLLGGGHSTETPSLRSQPLSIDPPSSEELLRMVGRPGTKLYSASGTDYRGRIDSDGVIHTAGVFGGASVGRIDGDGYIYRGMGLSERLAGRIDDAGNIYRTGVLGDDYVGKIDQDGFVRGAGLGLEIVGRVQS